MFKLLPPGSPRSAKRMSLQGLVKGREKLWKRPQPAK
jgi:hypothetical protein